MLRSMYSGISGLKVNQTKLDVIGNNIANVGTTAFKNQRIRFQDVLSQNLKFGTGASANVGGTNPSQVGLGVEVAGIDTMVSQGNMQPTGRNLDFAVDGDGYFVVARGKAEETLENLDVYYTRDGSFTLDDQGQLLTSDGYRVLGYQVAGAEIDNTVKPPTLKIPTKEDTSAKDKASEIENKAITALEEAIKNLNNQDLNNELKAVLGNVTEELENLTKELAKVNEELENPTEESEKADLEKKRAELNKKITALIADEGALEDLSKSITVYNIAKLKGNSKESEVMEILDKKLGGKAGKYITAIRNKERVDAAGERMIPEQSDEVTAEGILKPLIIPDEVIYGDDEPMKIKNFSVDKNGTINAVLANNQVVAIGQIGMSSFKNPAGLYKEGKNLYSTSASSGDALYRGGVGSGENEEGYGDIIQGRLEMSNVDLAEQFTEMIVASRAFQANGKIITTGDEILQDLVNLKR